MAKVAILGNKKSGKTQIFKKLTFPKGIFESTYEPTLGLDYCSILRDPFRFQIWDTSGECKKNLLKGMDVAIYCVDLSKPLDEEKIHSDMQNYRNYTSDRPLEIPIILVGTKADLNSQRKISDDEFQTFSEKYNFKKGITTSSKDSVNTDELLDMIYNVVSEINPDVPRIHDKANSFFPSINPSNSESNTKWKMSAWEKLAWFCLPVVGWAYLAYYYIYTTCYKPTFIVKGYDSDSLSYESF
ncbi:MAG: GTP-binding protein [Tatlockia sp.]|nr:GTP-binding protein [Tatlockia sp.]